MLGKAPDAEVARRINRTTNGVRIMRTRLGIASAYDGRLKNPKFAARKNGFKTKSQKTRS